MCVHFPRLSDGCVFTFLDSQMVVCSLSYRLSDGCVFTFLDSQMVVCSLSWSLRWLCVHFPRLADGCVFTFEFPGLSDGLCAHFPRLSDGCVFTFLGSQMVVGSLYKTAKQMTASSFLHGQTDGCVFTFLDCQTNGCVFTFLDHQTFATDDAFLLCLGRLLMFHLEDKRCTGNNTHCSNSSTAKYKKKVLGKVMKV